MHRFGPDFDAPYGVWFGPDGVVPRRMIFGPHRPAGNGWWIDYMVSPNVELVPFAALTFPA